MIRPISLNQTAFKGTFIKKVADPIPNGIKQNPTDIATTNLRTRKMYQEALDMRDNDKIVFCSLTPNTGEDRIERNALVIYCKKENDTDVINKFREFQQLEPIPGVGVKGYKDQNGEIIYVPY